MRPRAWKAWRERRRFLGQFVSAGDLVFDIGANVGEYAATFQQLACKVIAVEPNPELAGRLSFARLPGVTVEQAAVSDTEGEATLMIGERHREATIDDRYVTLLQDRGEHPRGIVVPTTTLDLLAARHGEPALVKIDVEGHELAVLRGMSFQPRWVSFEVHPSLRDVAQGCLELLQARGYRFRGTVGFDYVWRTDETDASGILRLIEQVHAENPQLFGDVYARRPLPLLRYG